MVPRNDKDLVAVPPERVRRLREHLINELRDLRKAAHLERFASPAQPEPPALAARVARTAYSLCKGWCCRNGDDDAFLDDRTLARVRLAKPDMTGAPCCGYLSIAGRCMQQLFCGRSRRLHENRRGCSNKGHRRRRRQDADLAGSDAVGGRSRY